MHACSASLVSLAAICLKLVPAAALELNVIVHYPQQNSAVDRCGFQFVIGTDVGKASESEEVPTTQYGNDSYHATLQLPDSLFLTQVLVGVIAKFGDVSSKECQAVCPRMGPQGEAVQSGVFLQTEPLLRENEVNIWPAFCVLDPVTTEASFFSEAIGREVVIKTRIPATYVENPLPRPSGSLPPIMFRFNSEWYWSENEKLYDTWHTLMVAGELEPFVVSEIYIAGNDWQAWSSQPIYTTEKLQHSCGKCDSEIEFVCRDWERAGYAGYTGGNHSFGEAGAFFDDLYDLGLPPVLQQLPPRTDDATLRVGAWGYCIGGLAAWNALVTRPDRFNIGYLGSPAVDFNCGHALLAADSFAWGGLRPKIYIDSGSAEGPLMNQQSVLLLRKLKRKGLVEGKDIFYTRATFGTHQGRSLLRRAHVGLHTLFGTRSRTDMTHPDEEADLSHFGQVAVHTDATSETMVSAQHHPLPALASYDTVYCILIGTASVLAFVLGRWTVTRKAGGRGSVEPLLA